MASSPQDAIIIGLPWELIAEFLTLTEILTTRLVSRSVISWVHDLSPQTCGAMLEQALKSRNMHLVPRGSWEDAVQDQQGIADMLIRDNIQHSSPLDITLRCFRVLKSIPMEVAVAFNGEYGRHCIPLEYNVDKHITEFKLQKACSRRKCKTCQLFIPACEDPDTTINKYLTVPDKHGKKIDLTRFYNKCVPNLPPDLICPSCRCSDKRTLVLSVLSYPSNSATTKSTLLTYTPLQQEGTTTHGKIETGDNEEEPVPPRKRPRIASPKQSFAFPPICNDLSIPTRRAPLEQDSNIKHAIAIHCVSCTKFGVVAPAGPCLNERFPCHERARLVTVGRHATTIGGIYVRRKCSNQRCLQAVSCETCSREVWHLAYDRQDRSNSVGVATVKTRCEHCNIRYCNDGQCARLTSVCHHS
jgi:hypothetical protein